MLTVLIADDNRQLVSVLSAYSRKEGYQVLQAYDGREALDYFEKEAVDLILLDVMMPEIDGFEVCRQIRKTSMVPVIMITAKSEDFDKIMGLDIGADDYVVKPFSPGEVMARVRAILRRIDRVAGGGDAVESAGGFRGNAETAGTSGGFGTSGGSNSSGNSGVSGNLAESDSYQQVFSYDNLSICMDTQVVTISGTPVPLTRKEIDLLWLMATRKNRVFTRDNLLDLVWGIDTVNDIRTVDSHIKRLRAKLSTIPHPAWTIKTMWGSGYKFEVNHEA